MRLPNYRIHSDVAGEPLVVKDVGPWDRYPTITNAADELVAHLTTGGLLPKGRRLLYYDSEGQLDEIVIEGGLVVGFKPGPRG